MIKQNINIRQSTLTKLQNLCSSTTERSPDSPHISSATDTSKEQNVDDMEFMDGTVSIAEEQWQKPSPRRSAKKKGKYLNSTSKKLNFNPSMSQKNPQEVKDLNATNFKEYERLVWPDVSSQNRGYYEVKKEIKKKWTKHQKQKKLDDERTHFKPMSNSPKNLTTTPHCICRQKKNANVVSCVLCNQVFHCDCVDFCSGLARLGETNYFCTNCIYKTFVPFVLYTLRLNSKLATHHLSKEDVSKLNDEFCVSDYSDVMTQARQVIVQDTERYTDFNFPVITQPNRGVRNIESNCWLSSTLQCLATTPLCQLLERWVEYSDDTSMLIHDTIRTLKFLISPTNRSTALKLQEGPLNIAQSCGMTPNRMEHKDSSEFLNLLLNRINDQLPLKGKQELDYLFRLTTLELNRCLVPTCHSLSGKSNTTWNILLHIPTSPYSIRLQSLLWTRVYGRFSTEDDEVCSKCAEGKPVVHHSELALAIPSTFTLTINRTKIENHAKVHTPVICNKIINLRGIVAEDFDEKDINFNLRAAILHKGSSIGFGHFISCIFNCDDTAFVYDDEAVNILDSKTLINSNDFKKSVYMCFYGKEEEKATPGQNLVEDSEDNYENAPWHLSVRSRDEVEQIWTYKKELFYGNDKISSYHLKTLKDGNWLSGDVVNSFLERIGNKLYPNSRLHIFPTYLYTALGNSSRKGGVLSHALSVDPFNYKILMFPVNTGDHWSLLLCYPMSFMLA